jgi:hypothetical protein
MRRFHDAPARARVIPSVPGGTERMSRSIERASSRRRETEGSDVPAGSRRARSPARSSRSAMVARDRDAVLTRAHGRDVPRDAPRTLTAHANEVDEGREDQEDQEDQRRPRNARARRGGPSPPEALRCPRAAADVGTPSSWCCWRTLRISRLRSSAERPRTPGRRSARAPPRS